MKKTTAKRFEADPVGMLALAQGGRVLITRNGKPVALLMGLENYDEEDIGYMTSGSFWREVRKWRRSPTRSWEEAKKELLGKNRAGVKT
jgi:antitoxin (DNA-binding transcriptional repressor) of toxin-antitoxin stability system